MESFRFTINIGSGKVNMYVYDSAGQEDYDRLRPLDYMGADVVLFWYNVTSPDSSENVLEKVCIVLLYLCLYNFVATAFSFFPFC